MIHEKKVKDHEGLYRVPSGAIVNKDDIQYQRYINERDRLNNQEHRINKIECELSDIKNLLIQLLDKAQ